MSVLLISYTTSVHPELKSLSDIIVYSARVSNPMAQLKNMNNSRLINYLIEHKHWSPFEMVDVTVEITTTLDIATQILRHRSFSFQQFSMRYADTEKMDLGMTEVIRETRLNDPKNRQGSRTVCFTSSESNSFIHER